MIQHVHPDNTDVNPYLFMINFTSIELPDQVGENTRDLWRLRKKFKQTSIVSKLKMQCYQTLCSKSLLIRNFSMIRLPSTATHRTVGIKLSQFHCRKLSSDGHELMSKKVRHRDCHLYQCTKYIDMFNIHHIRAYPYVFFPMSAY